MKTVIGIILILVALFIAYIGITGLQESSSAINVLGLELRAEDSSAKQVAIIELVGAVIAFVGGLYLLKSKKR